MASCQSNHISHVVHYTKSDHDGVVGACSIDVEQKTDKVSVVVVTDAVVYPWTVVIYILT